MVLELTPSPAISPKYSQQTQSQSPPLGSQNTPKHLKSAVPNLFGTRDQFCGRQFFHEPGRVAGMVQAVI